MNENNDDAINPSHYKWHPAIECIDVVEHFCSNLANVIEYVWRADHKGNDIEDLKKAQWYLAREIKRRGG